MAIKWTSDLTVGVNQIDEQHKVLFEKTDQLFEAGKSGKSKEYVGQMLDFLDEYTRQHFQEEEVYMASIKYPGLEEQKRMHAAFIDQLAKLKQDYVASGGNIALIINLNQTILNWLTSHISTVDKKLGTYAKSLK